MISYAQNFEDVILNRVFNTQTTGFYIDVGAMDPVEGSVTKSFYDRGWSGINVEPDARFHMKLAAERRRDINLNVALGASEETRVFYEFEEQGISTFSDHFRDYFVERGRPFKKVTCQVLPTAEICRKHVSGPIDFLKIDAEGWEGPILHGGDWANFRPTVILIEATEPFSHTPAWGDWEPFLIAECGYIFVYFDGLNRFYIRQESRELESMFRFPPNVLDDFQMYATVRAEQSASELRIQLNAQSEQIAAQSARIEELEKQLIEMRNWAGHLSERLAALESGQFG